MHIECKPASFLLGFHSQGVEVCCSIVPGECGAYDLRPWPACLRERNQRGLWLIQLQRVIHSARSGALVGNTKTYIRNLPLRGEVELMNPAILRINRVPGNGLGRDTSAARRKRI